MVNFPFLTDKNFVNAFSDYSDMRKKIKSNLTDRAVTLVLSTLHKEKKEVAIKMLEQSTMNSWKGVFPLKEKQKSEEEPYADVK